MKRNKMLKVMLAVLTLVVLLGVAGTVFADDAVKDGYTEVTPIEPGDGVSDSIGSITGKILYIAQMIGYAVAVIMLIVLGIKYITASPDGKAEIKKSVYIYVVGALGIFAASTLVGILKNMFTTL